MGRNFRIQFTVDRQTQEAAFPAHHCRERRDRLGSKVTILQDSDLTILTLCNKDSPVGTGGEGDRTFESAGEYLDLEPFHGGLYCRDRAGANAGEDEES